MGHVCICSVDCKGIDGYEMLCTIFFVSPEDAEVVNDDAPIYSRGKNLPPVPDTRIIQIQKGNKVKIFWICNLHIIAAGLQKYINVWFFVVRLFFVSANLPTCLTVKQIYISLQLKSKKANQF